MSDSVVSPPKTATRRTSDSRSWRPSIDGKRVCVVVPMFNEASTIADVVRDLREYFLDVLCVDDGSKDQCAEVARTAGATVLRHLSNLGQGAALQTGLEFVARNMHVDHVVTFDADGQHRVQDAVQMVCEARRTGVDVVLGSRFLNSRSDIPRRRRWLLRASVLFTRATTGLCLTDSHNGLRVFSASAAALINLRLPGMAHASELLQQISAARMSYIEHSVTILYTKHSLSKGQSGINAVNIAYDLLVQKIRLAS